MWAPIDQIAVGLGGEVDAERFARGLLQEEVVWEEHELSNEGGSG